MTMYFTCEKSIQNTQLQSIQFHWWVYVIAALPICGVQ